MLREFDPFCSISHQLLHGPLSTLCDWNSYLVVRCSEHLWLVLLVGSNKVILVRNYWKISSCCMDYLEINITFRIEGISISLCFHCMITHYLCFEILEPHIKFFTIQTLKFCDQSSQFPSLPTPYLFRDLQSLITCYHQMIACLVALPYECRCSYSRYSHQNSIGFFYQWQFDFLLFYHHVLAILFGLFKP